MTRRYDWDLLAIDGRIHSLEREGEVFTAMAVKDGRIARLFTALPAWQEQRRARTVIDLHRRVVLPGLIDGHMHFLASAVVRTAACIIADMHPDGLRPQSMEDVRRTVCAWARRMPAHQLVFCFSYIIELVAEKRLPRRDELDSWLPGREVIVFSMDGHSSSLSTPALRRLGLTEIAVDGVLQGRAHELSMGAMNERVAKDVSVGMLARGIQAVANEALSHGLVCLHCMEGYEDQTSDPSLWLLARCGGTLPVDLRLFVQYRDPARLSPYRRFLRNPRIGGCYGWAMDGSISSGTAALDEPYLSDPATQGRLYFDPAEAAALVSRAVGAGFQVTAHAIGGRGIESLLHAYEQVLDGKGNPRRHRIDHFELPTRAQVARAIGLDLALTVQPGFAWLDERFLGGYRRQLAPSTWQRQVPLRTIAEAGGRLVGSSDYPAGPLSPWIHMQGMMDYPVRCEALSLYQALRTYTVNAAWSTGEEAERGSLTPGKKADFIVMEEDPFEMPASALHAAGVRETWISGKRAQPLHRSTAAFMTRALLGPRKKI